MKKIALVIINLLTSVLLFAQDYKKDMQALSNEYNKDGYVSIGIKIKVYQPSKSAPAMTQEAVVKKKDRNFFCSMNGNKMLLTQSSFLYINESGKDIVLQEIDKEEYNKYMQKMLSVSMDSLESSYDSIRYAGIENGTKHYTLYSSSGEIKRTEVYMDAKSHFLTKLIYHYDAKKASCARVEIAFTNSTEAIAEDYFNVSKYLTKSGKDYKLKPAYSSYQLVVNKN